MKSYRKFRNRSSKQIYQLESLPEELDIRSMLYICNKTNKKFSLRQERERENKNSIEVTQIKEREIKICIETMETKNPIETEKKRNKIYVEAVKISRKISEWKQSYTIQNRTDSNLKPDKYKGRMISTQTLKRKKEKQCKNSLKR